MGRQYKVSEASFSARFQGSTVDAHQIPVRDLVPTLLALAEAVEAANRIIGDPDHKPSVNIKATKPGSFIVDLTVTAPLLQGIATDLLGFLNSGIIGGAANVATIVDAILNSITLMKEIDGRAITATSPAPDNKTHIHLADGTTLEAPAGEAVLIQSAEYRVAIGNAADIVARPGIESMELSSPWSNTVRLTAEDRVAIRPELLEACNEEVLLDEEHEVLLRLLQVSFQEGRKWRVREGDDNEVAFMVTVNDSAFLAKIQSGEEAFRSDDTVRAKMRTRQTRQGNGKIVTSRELTRILEHRSMPATGTLDLGI